MLKRMSWIRRYGRDKYYRLAKSMNKPSRAYFKLRELDSKHALLKRGYKVIDLGSSPGGWVSYELERVGEEGLVFAIDKDELRIKPHNNLVFIKADILNTDLERLISSIGVKVDLVASDLAPSFTGIRSVDMARHYELAHKALELAQRTLGTGNFVVKLFMSDEFYEFQKELIKTFEEVKIERLPATREKSSELYAVCKRVRAHS
ncbi:hypothetical protein B9Q02_08445 [Candidatus Marsarchaeota G1 archaeon BE_D]|uniref:Ribosomal RNA large subunit methyltransferase E n=3 Tax=Candidatus Marsarchaeota TaxID=1978152 RepID=A0A2R6AEY4_9ARCH|nr:MAG: hypothetical protein B9Q02_08445 [Candidatus Marsarchaeota G1 archaeon BE_D]